MKEHLEFRRLDDPRSAYGLIREALEEIYPHWSDIPPTNEGIEWNISEGNLFVGAFDGEEIVGFSAASLREVFTEVVGTFLLTYVKPNYRKLGVAYDLRKYELDEMIRMGAKRIFATFSCQHPSSPKAAERLGLKPYGITYAISPREE